MRTKSDEYHRCSHATARNKKQLGMKTSQYWSRSLVVTPATLIRTNKQVESQNARMAAWEGDALEKQVYPKKEEQSTNTSLLVIMYRNFSAGSSGKKIRKEVFPDQEEQRRPPGHKTEALGKGKKPLHQLQVSDRFNLTEKANIFLVDIFHLFTHLTMFLGSINTHWKKLWR